MKQKQTWRGRRAWLVVLLPVLVLMAGTPAWAQRTVGDLRGTVTDSSGAVVPGATVLITNVNKGYTRELVSDTKGDFAAPVLDPGQYRVEVTAGSFKKSSQVVTIAALATTNVAVKLELGGLSETVEITAPPEGVNVSTGGVAQHLNKEVLEMPNLNHYGFSNATLMPAINQSEERRETINASVAGNDSNRNAFYIDGAEATDPWRGWSPRQPIADAFEEIVVNTAGASVDVGSNFGGTYNAVFKSGTNQFHGSAWYYFRDKGMNANSWVNNRVGLAKPDDPLKYWGGQIGGPVVKDKLFFYFTANRETDAQPYSQSGLFAPTQAMVNGDFSAVPFTIYDPKTGQPFPGNQIPASRIDPTAKAFWDKYGYNIGNYGPNYNFQFANERKVWNFNGRVDYNINNQHRLTLSGYYFENKTTSPDARVQSISGGSTGGTSGNTFQKGGNELSDFPQTVLNAKWTWTPSSNLVFETHAAYSKMPEKVTLAQDSLGTTLQTLGANDALPRPDAPEILPTMVIGNWWGDSEGAVLFNGWTTDFTVKNLTAGSSATWIKSSHSVKVGAEFQDGSFNTIKPARDGRNGITFNGNVTSLSNPSSRRQGRDLRPLLCRLPAGQLRQLRAGRRLRPDAAVVEPRPLRDGHVASDPAADRHTRAPPRGQQRDQRAGQPADGLCTGAAIDAVPDLPVGRRRRGRRGPAELPGRLADQGRTAPQLRLRRDGRRQDRRPGLGRPLLRPRRDGPLRDGVHAPAALHRWQRDVTQRRPVEPLAHQPEPDLLGAAGPVHATRTPPATSGRPRCPGSWAQLELRPRLVDAVECRRRARDPHGCPAGGQLSGQQLDEHADLRPRERGRPGPTARTTAGPTSRRAGPNQFLGDNNRCSRTTAAPATTSSC